MLHRQCGVRYDSDYRLAGTDTDDSTMSHKYYCPIPVRSGLVPDIQHRIPMIHQKCAHFRIAVPINDINASAVTWIQTHLKSENRTDLHELQFIFCFSHSYRRSKWMS